MKNVFQVFGAVLFALVVLFFIVDFAGGAIVGKETFKHGKVTDKREEVTSDTDEAGFTSYSHDYYVSVVTNGGYSHELSVTRHSYITYHVGDLVRLSTIHGIMSGWSYTTTIDGKVSVDSLKPPIPLPAEAP